MTTANSTARDGDNNPLLAPWTGEYGLPPFAAVHAEHFAPAFDAAMRAHLEEIDAIAGAAEPPSFANTVGALDRTSDVAVDAYNAKVEQRDKLIDTYQSRVTAYNVKAEQVKATKESYEKTCENRRYDERDLNDIKRKK